MESYFDRDFSGVRTHTDTKSARSAEAINARAYSLGQDIVFGGGAYAPDETEGKKLLAHELFHVTQQTDESTQLPTSPGSLSVGSASDAEEHAADRAAEKMMALEVGDSITNQASSPSQTSTGLVRRKEASERTDTTPGVSVEEARTMGSLTLDGFAIDSADLTSTHQAQINELAERILNLHRQYPGATVTVVGHTDATGSEPHNMELGQQRADAVREALENAGVPSDIIITRSRGEESLLVDTQLYERRNRRVEVIFQPGAPAQPEIQPPTPSPPETEPERPPLDLRLDLPIRPETPEERLERILTTPIPTLPPRRSFNDIFWERVNDGLDDIMDRFNIPERWRSLIRRAARAGIERAAQEILDQALDSADIHGEAREAIEAAARAAMETPIIP